jgi:hypothetical protein
MYWGNLSPVVYSENPIFVVYVPKSITNDWGP